MKLLFPETPSGTLAELWRACLDLLPQLGRKVVYDVTIGTSSTPVEHGLGYIPTTAIPVLHSDARVWRSANPDAKYVYFAASGSVICDIEIVR
jgi:hypothetical protein